LINFIDSNYGAWMPADAGMPHEMPPYQMNCRQMENTAMDPVAGVYYENQPVLHYDNTIDSVLMTNPGDSAYVGDNSPDDFDQSYQRLIHNAETIRNETNFKQYKQTQPQVNYNEASPFPPPITEMIPGSSLRKSRDRDFDMEKQLRRLRNNEASRRSRREKKRRFMEIERRVEEMKASNKRLTDFVQELDSIIEEAKAILLTVRWNTNFQPSLPNWEPYQ
uniref:BZIP domain-containing protein n=1 Tax=Hymenolepis diminuta TaxID=6216 RepID=A0A0R3SVK6_HYMDI